MAKTNIQTESEKRIDKGYQKIIKWKKMNDKEWLLNHLKKHKQSLERELKQTRQKILKLSKELKGESNEKHKTSSLAQNRESKIRCFGY